MIRPVSPKKLYSFFIDPELLAGLRVIKDRDGIGESEQIRRAVAEWLKKAGVTKTAPRRAPTRRKA